MSRNEIRHYGILRKSGRYPWDSGKDTDTAMARSAKFYQIIDDIKRKDPGIKEVDIATAMGLSVAQFRDTKSIAKDEIVRAETVQAVKLKAANNSVEAIAKEMGISTGVVRLRLKNSESLKQSQLISTANLLRNKVDEHKIINIGKGVNLELGVAETRFRAALGILHDEGYESHNLKTRNVGTKNQTTTKVLVPPGTGWQKAMKMLPDLHTIGDWSLNDGVSFLNVRKPLDISSDRLKVNYKEDGGTDLDGMIYVRPGVKDLDMGKNNYAQVRISIDGTHFIKGMAIYNSNMPPGADLVFNTNKSKTEGKLGVLKKQTGDPDNPFGSIIKRQLYETVDGKDKVTSGLNLVNEEGDWHDWRKSLPSQMLAKQPHSFITSQLKTTRDQVRDRLAEIDKITNPVVKKDAMLKYAEKIDSDAVDLRAAAMPRQRTQVIIPIPALAKHEIYAPHFETGEQLVLIRYPHGGRFEIPEVIVNNGNRTAKKLLGNAADAIGIHPSVAEKLSGADFDGDTVIAIPNPKGTIKGINSLGRHAKYYEDRLKGFEPKTQYGGYEIIKPAHGKKGDDDYVPEKGNFKLMTQTGLQMGMITNLITDMSIQGASPEHMVRAVKHSMVVIDAEKHKLDWKASEEENGIRQLKTLYQGSPKAGAQTLLSQATANLKVPERKLRLAGDGGPINPDGSKAYVPTGRKVSVYDKKTGTYLPEKTHVLEDVKRLRLTDDAYTLVRDPKNAVERLYADHANEMKGLANTARLTASKVHVPKANPQAKVVYKAEVEKLYADLDAAKKTLPLERHANLIAKSIVLAKRQEDPGLHADQDRLRKVERQAKASARNNLGLKDHVIEISDTQWDAIQSNAVSPTKLREILHYADEKRVADLAMPRTNAVMTSAVSSRAKAMLAAGNSPADVASALGISASTLNAAVKRGDV